ncbi:MAG: peptide ABC transporter substrate-binding protein [Desulfobacterales bacterium S5133MH4]|nr:MAG: peptide ABC transporter substrate-binding protein [Desulfobacterales bacterium S5133MH4]
MKRIVIYMLLLTLFRVAGAAFAGSIIIDKSGNTVLVQKPFTRIISLYGAHTENLFSLGLDEEIIGVSKNEAYPPKALTKAVFSYHDDAEKFLAAHADLVLIRPMIGLGYRSLVKKLKDAGITVVSLQPRDVNEMYDYWKALGTLTGREDQATKMIKGFQARLSAVRSVVETIPKKQQKRVYFEAIHSKMKTFAPTSMAIFVLEAAGGVNVADDAVSIRGTNIAAYGKEHILSHADEIDVYLAQNGTMNHATIMGIKEEGGFKAIKAVKNDQVYIINEMTVSRPTLRLLEGICEIGKILYPDRFVR